jgi:hypothetical protein
MRQILGYADAIAYFRFGWVQMREKAVDQNVWPKILCREISFTLLKENARPRGGETGPRDSFESFRARATDIL